MELISKELSEAISKQLSGKQFTVAVAESVSAGLLQSSFAGMENAMGFFQGGLTAYNLAQKTRQLDVEPIHAESVHCVSCGVAEQMASGIQKRFLSDWGIAITGFARPVPESDNKVYAYFGISYHGEIIDSGKLVPTEKEMLTIQLEYTNTLLKKFLHHLQKQKMTKKASKGK